MLSVSRRASRTALISCLLLWGSSAVAQVNPAWVSPLVLPSDIAVPEPAAPLVSAQTPAQGVGE
jgi:hypothetical protein